MKLTRILAPCAAVGLALLLLPPRETIAYSLLGGDLGLDQRDFRVFNNFTDPQANDNTLQDPNFPGQTGAVVAIWKGVAEWGSELRGDGGGDPHQPGGLGSGMANFDSSFQGLVNDPGGVDDNVISEISGSGAGVLAFTELPIADGWRIRFYSEPYVWFDGPEPTVQVDDDRDMQGVACHEYGHALGLGHSSDSSATMWGSAGNTNVKRSIENDDRAGLQAIYNSRSPVKPRILSYSLASGNVVITGANFSPTNNEVWFTRGSGTGDGTPVKVTGVSSNGTQITVAIPAEAGPGDLLVKQNSNFHGSLSNAYPFDPVNGPCAGAQVYGTPKTTSTGQSPMVSISGLPSAGLGNVQLTVGPAVPFANAVLFYGRGPGQMPFMGGELLVGRPIVRDQAFQLGFLGISTLNIPIDASMIGTTRNYQVWFQDPGDPFGVGLSNAVEITFCP